MKFTAPFESSAHITILSAAEHAGHDREALRRLLWLVNAHPTLVAHVQVFRNVLAMLESAACQPEELAWAGDWAVDIPAWRALCRWMSHDRLVLARLPGLDEFDRQPRHAHDNPHVRQGVGRHGVAACLWNRHQNAPTYPPEASSPDSASRYFTLQTQVFLSYVESRHRLSDLGTYEHHAGLDEWPVAPAPTSALGLAVREFSHAHYAALLSQFPAAASPLEYTRALIGSEFVVDESLFPATGDSSDSLILDAVRYLETIRRYFRRFALVMGGWVPPQRRRQGRGGSGGHGWRSGFVHYQPGSRVLISKRDPTPDDPDLPYQQSDQVWIDLTVEEDGCAGTMAGEVERLENLEALFRLYDPEEIGGRLHQRRLQDLAMESHAQHFAFDYTRPTREELFDLHQHLESAIDDYLHGNPGNVQKARIRARAALILKVMIALGQPLECARQLRFATISARQLFRGELPAVDGPTLLLVDAEAGVPCCGPVAGFCMPAIGPAYQRALTDPPEDVDETPGVGLEEINRPLVDAFLLPDALGVGQQLHRFLEKQERPNHYIFGVEPAAAKSSALELLRETAHDRLTPEKIRRVLPGVLRDQGFDQTVGWMLTGDTTRANEPRMFYTRHSVANLQRAYARATRRLARDLGTQPLSPDILDSIGSENAPSVGARFVIRRDDLKGLITGLKEQLKDYRRMPLELSGIQRYHDAYLLFTWLMQSLHTTVRPTSRPNGLYTSWTNAAGTGKPIWVGLAEKDNRYSEKARAICLPPLLDAQFFHYRQHFRALSRRLGLSHKLKSQKQADLPLLVIGGGGKIQALRPAWIEEQLRSRFAPLPANFHRSFLRTELLERGCCPEAVDAFMGHANLGESPYSLHSTLDYGLFWAEIENALRSLHEALELEAIPSRLVPFPSRVSPA